MVFRAYSLLSLAFLNKKALDISFAQLARMWEIIMQHRSSISHLLVFNGFDTLDTNTGWVLRMTIKQDNKIAWQIFEARLDKNGIPKNKGLVQRHE